MLRVELIVGGMSIDIEDGENGQKTDHSKVRFLLMVCFILCDLRIVERGLQVDDYQGPVEELTPQLEDLDAGELEVLEVRVA